MSRQTKIANTRDHMRSKEMWTGSKSLVELPLRMIENQKVVVKKCKLTPALLKMYDEIIVNACDHVTNIKKTKNIWFVYTSQGQFLLKNDGPGIPLHRFQFIYEQDIVKDMRKVDDGTMHIDNGVVKPDDSKILPGYSVKWNPQIIAEHPLSGTNIQERKLHITGGVNGAGMKIVNYHSTIFILETITNGIRYIQQFTNGIRDLAKDIHPPQITTTTEEDHTTITFELDLPAVGIKRGDVTSDVMAYLYYRAIQTSIFTQCNVFFNGEQIAIRALHELGTCVSLQPALEFHCTLHNEFEGRDLYWNISIAASNKFEQISIVNGMDMIRGGTHIEHIRDQLVSYVIRKVGNESDPEKLKSLTTKIRSKLFILMCGYINKPSLDSQSKEKIGNSKSQYAAYQFSDTQLRQFWKVFGDHMLLALAEKAPKKLQKKDIDKCREPTMINKRGQKSCKQPLVLFIPEGDSATGMLHEALTNKKIPLTYEYYGTFSIQGVPVNALRESKIVHAKEGDVIIRSQTLDENHRIRALYSVLGLDYNKSYITDAEFATLRYDYIIIAVDQDEDGKGNICSLILNYFARFWPALIYRGFVKRLNTPIIRTFTKGKKTTEVLNFMSVPSFDNWKAELKLTEDEFKKQYMVYYYKGLAGHSPEDILDIFSKFNENLITYTWDDAAAQNFQDYFGSDTSKRKEHIASSQIALAPEASLISCSTHLNTEALSYMRYNLGRKLPGFDGLLTGARKVLTTARHEHSKINVSSLGGKVKGEMHYQHGDAAINNTIIRMGQEFFPNQLPLLLGNSVSNGFGSRTANGNDAGEPRYISLIPNHKLLKILYPPEDDCLYPYQFTDGKRCEPVSYCPIIPMALVENLHLPGSGWKVQIWGVDALQLIENTRHAIQTSGESELPRYVYPFPYNTHGWKGKIVEIEHNGKKVEYSVGAYERLGPDTIRITELPFGIYSKAFCEGDKKKEDKKEEAFEKQRKRDKRTETTSEVKTGTLDQILPTNILDQILQSTSNNSQPTSNGHISEPAKFSIVDQILAQQQITRPPLIKTPSLESDLLEYINGDEEPESKHIDPKQFMDPDKYYSHVAKRKPGVKDVHDYSNNEQIDIVIEFNKGVLDQIMEMRGQQWDPIVTYFPLMKTPLHKHINLIGFDNSFKHYTSYQDVFVEWFIYRRYFYIQRIKRQITLIQLEKLILQQKNKFCDEMSKQNLKLQKLPKEQWDTTMEEIGIRKIHHTIVSSPGFTPTQEITYLALESPHISYSYIYGMTQSATQQTEYDTREKKIKELDDLLKVLSTEDVFKGARQWLSELDQLEQIIKRARIEGWGYDFPKRTYRR